MAAEIGQVQKTVFLRTAGILRKVLDSFTVSHLNTTNNINDNNSNNNDNIELWCWNT